MRDMSEADCCFWFGPGRHWLRAVLTDDAVAAIRRGGCWSTPRFAAPRAERVVLDSAAALIDLGVRVLDDMERVRDLSRMADGRNCRRPVRWGPTCSGQAAADSPRAIM